MDHKRSFNVKLVLAFLLLPWLCFGELIYTGYDGVTNYIAAQNTNTYPAVFPLSSSQVLGVQVTFVCGATNALNQTFYFDSTCNGRDWISGFLVWQFAANGTNVVTKYTNLTSLGGISALRLWPSNDNANAASVPTNVFITGYRKINQ